MRCFILVFILSFWFSALAQAPSQDYVVGAYYLRYDRVNYLGTVYELHDDNFRDNNSSNNPLSKPDKWRVYNYLVSGSPAVGGGSGAFGAIPANANLSADYAVVGWLFLAGLGAGILSKVLGNSVFRALNSR
jgi:hypothetical protein